MAAVPDGWQDFFVAMAGGSAALAGLVMVALSVNIKAILALPWLPPRAGAAVASLVLAVVVCGLALVPGQPAALLGAEVLVGAGLTAVPRLVYLRRSAGLPQVTPAARTASIVLTVLQLVPLVVGAALLLAGFTGVGWIAAGILLVVVASMLDAWVLMVEILR
ncbi:hypothetical protein [Georgenia ruanii]|uniref:hypothetical protein n=1 Tax=Georgenia ruanii TaxID=348442 RepID=UPI00126597C6|nr:hypothetical protein [Georgenia ruanii]